MMTQWIANAMERVMFEHDLFHCSFCNKAKFLDEKAICEEFDQVCLDCHKNECHSYYCIMEGNFYYG